MVLPATLGILLVGLPLSDSVIKDLNSPSYEVREKAQETLRASYRPPTPESLAQLSNSMHLSKGESTDQVIQDCHAHHISLLAADNGLSYVPRTAPGLDWLLLCSFRNGVLDNFSFALGPAVLKNDPPPDYTGLWRTYRVNGEKVSEIYYMSGKPAGPLGDSPKTEFNEPLERMESIRVEPSR